MTKIIASTLIAVSLLAGISSAANASHGNSFFTQAQYDGS